MAFFIKPANETINQKKDRLMGQYPHNTWCPECLKRMVDSTKAALIGEQLFCSDLCAKTYRTENRKVNENKKRIRPNVSN